MSPPSRSGSRRRSAGVGRHRPHLVPFMSSLTMSLVLFTFSPSLLFLTFISLGLRSITPLSDCRFGVGILYSARWCVLSLRDQLGL